MSSTAMKYDRATIEQVGDAFRVYVWGTYGRSSVLAGQYGRAFLTEGSMAECKAALASEHPRLPVEVLEHRSHRPQISVAHLPGEDDMVPGGALPDDIGEWPPEP